MSAIAGIINFKQTPTSPAHIELMLRAMILRGRDRQHSRIFPDAAIGHCLHLTTKESLQESQPLTDEGASVVLSMDGRLDNTEDLRSALHRQGLFFSGASDPELVMAAWKVWGSDCLRHLEGDFALLVHDLVKGYTFCARDRVGNKPLHYCWTGSSLLVASTASGILAHPLMDSAENCPPDEATLAEFLAASFVSSTDTFWTPVKRLPPATAMIVDARGPRLFNWWKPDTSKAIRYKNPQDYVIHYRELLTRTVRQMSRSAYPLAVEASGGLDSSALLATSLELRQQDKLCAPAINAYAMVFPEEPEADESVWIRIL